ncbi:hypothetical protein [Tenacibaculum ovolyticum]|uniref:hypothetical protein n=1 Tax=Tenacibaculum ovolyticum TaxID=104270 RepID=UPI0003F4FA99|nr:hypothetical protein [Tenacibaculum ovolyticum]
MKKIKLLSLVLVVLLTSCASLKMAPYDQYSYQKSVEIKIDTENIIAKATTTYAENSIEIERLKNDMRKIVAYEKYKPNNEITYNMWKIISDKEKNLIAGFLNRWEKKGKLSSYFVKEANQQITEAMNLLVRFEGKKEIADKNQLLQYIGNN